MSFTIGSSVKLTVFGSSHGHSVNALLEGIPSGLEADIENIQKWLEYRMPGSSDITTQRREKDRVEILSGLHGGLTDGSPVFFSIRNEDRISSHYDEIRFKPRPGHADLTMWYKYRDARNYEGSGFFSGRMTAPMVAAGALCLQVLNQRGITVTSWQNSVGDVALDSNTEPSGQESCYAFKTRIPSEERNGEAEELIRKLIGEGDSAGGIIKTRIDGLEPGIGEPFFDSVESTLSKLMFGIPGLKGIEFGTGFKLGGMTGKQAVDSIRKEGDKIITKTNHNGGILGGISNGMPVVFSVVMKPTSSIRSPLDTVNLETGENVKLTVVGRHDPCISIRAVPVVQTLSAVGICDLMAQAGELPRSIR